MKNFENELDEIRIKLYEETKALNTEDVIRVVNSHASTIANEFGISIENANIHRFAQPNNYAIP